jgi:hypothetical protein
MKFNLQTMNRLYPAESLDQIRMSPHRHRMALESLRQAESIVAMLTRAHQDLRQVFGLIGRATRALAHGGKSPQVASK